MTRSEYYQQNKEKINFQNKCWRLNNPERVKQSAREYYLKNKERIKQYRLENKERISKNNTEYKRKYFQENLNARLSNNLRRRLRLALNGFNKSQRMISLLGLSIQEFKDYLEAKFQEGMNWDNYGQWHIDHIRPCVSFDLSDPAQQKECFNYRNLQPLWAKDNLHKRTDKLLNDKN